MLGNERGWSRQNTMQQKIRVLVKKEQNLTWSARSYLVFLSKTVTWEERNLERGSVLENAERNGAWTDGYKGMLSIETLLFLSPPWSSDHSLSAKCLNWLLNWAPCCSSCPHLVYCNVAARVMLFKSKQIISLLCWDASRSYSFLQGAGRVLTMPHKFVPDPVPTSHSFSDFMFHFLSLSSLRLFSECGAHRSANRIFTLVAPSAWLVLSPDAQPLPIHTFT